MTLRVVIAPDTYSTLWVIQCVEPCAASSDGRWCMPAVPAWNGMAADHTRTLCWLGSAATRDGAAQMARAAGYEVVE